MAPLRAAHEQALFGKRQGENGVQTRIEHEHTQPSNSRWYLTYLEHCSLLCLFYLILSI